MSDGEEICSMENSKARWVQMECELGTGVICFIWVVSKGLSNMGTSEQGHEGQAVHMKGSAF